MKPGSGGLLDHAKQARLVAYFHKKVTEDETLDEADRHVTLSRLCWKYVFSRPQQIPPDDEWDSYFCLGGRGSGKTRTGSETLYEWAQEIPASFWAVVGPTLGSVRETQFEGPSGLVSVIPSSALWGGSVDSAYNSSRPQLKLANGAVLRGYSSEKPGRLRGPQFHGGWLDEPAEFKDSDKLPDSIDTTFNNYQLGLRNKAPGWEPRTILSGTPKPVQLLTGVPGDTEEFPGLLTGYPGVVVSRMSSFDNIHNLAGNFQRLLHRLDGTETGRQEIEAELLTDIKGTLWRQAWIKLGDPPPLADFSRIAVGVDPSGGADAIGIVVAGIDVRGMYWVLDDLTDVYTPAGWAEAVENAVDLWQADRVCVERNFGGDMCRDTLTRHTNISDFIIEDVWASRGKAVRAEPIAALYEPRKDRTTGVREQPGQRIQHADRFSQLVGQMTTWQPGRKSPNNMDALVWALTYLTEPNAAGYDLSDLLPQGTTPMMPGAGSGGRTY